MDKKEILEEFEAMEREAKKIIKTKEDKPSFMLGISDAAARMAGQNLEYADFIVREAKKRIKNIAEYSVN